MTAEHIEVKRLLDEAGWHLLAATGPNIRVVKHWTGDQGRLPADPVFETIETFGVPPIEAVRHWLNTRPCPTPNAPAPRATASNR